MPADFDEPMFDEDFVRNAAFTEPSARERAQPPRRFRRWRAARRLRGASGGRSGPRAWRARRGYREPSHRRAVIQVVGGVLVLLAISVALWWWQSGSRRADDERPVGPSTIFLSPLPSTAPSAPPSAPPSVRPPATEIPRVAGPVAPAVSAG
ncbi:SCO2583/SCO2584 N-terminal domain-containing protein [Actinomadura opuntiae]|uniref:SCO2583/SCO2584 N-terminal domain-containing protein n=1 Tax=Actinomadura sp. OS1-43 TaxID=604315 RepID=UPI00255AE40B|nr:hypothetical protein [Actinomadura sp. OS1-43]MDL4819218.1 hypothetical protein [Actinomadura sp. OS1-43]